MMSRPRYVFLDRDGTLVHDPGYVHRVEDYRMLDGVIAGLRTLDEAGFLFAIVTNQSGIGRGLYGVPDFERFQKRLLDDLARGGIRIDATYFCPHHPDAGCACRKPAAGLLERAERELDADLARSWVVGDSTRDVEMATNAGCRSVLIAATASAPSALPVGTPVAPDLVEAARIITAGT